MCCSTPPEKVGYPVEVKVGYPAAHCDGGAPASGEKGSSGVQRWSSFPDGGAPRSLRATFDSVATFDKYDKHPTCDQRAGSGNVATFDKHTSLTFDMHTTSHNVATVDKFDNGASFDTLKYKSSTFFKHTTFDNLATFDTLQQQPGFTRRASLQHEGMLM